MSEPTVRPATTPASPIAAPAVREPERRRRADGAAARRRPVVDSAASTAHQFQQLKGRIHRRLLERLNLANLDKTDRDRSSRRFAGSCTSS